ncbi:MAG: class I SAM-dependent methyltransferase [Chloroflexi bacterium]|nr:MAG: class I SAM-dependent methyltransferase [Chloroflexota bacterium]
MGRWSRPVAVEFLRWLNMSANGRWLDVGCGTGALCETIVNMAAPQRVTGIDFSEGFIRHARQLHPEKAYDFQVGSASDLPVEDDLFDVVVSGLALNFFPEPQTAVSELRRAVKPGGTVAVYLWDYANDMQMLRTFWDAAIALDPDATNYDEGVRFPLCQPEPLRKLFIEAGLQSVVVEPVDTTAVFRSFDDYWQPFLGKNGPAPGYVASRIPVQQIALANHLRQTLPIQPNGSVHLKMRAWAVRSIKS